ncbi:choline transporter-like protein 2 [Plakobranchus ocellatus]|uniref:Choline transporter-like protein n=1 Tax=Plakobranchus ocellatus TaxID=259542 RepID=A0AAV4CDQ2_9GAST|nr:choline transporter-like protein 2 [Plakobranchus ocellatus]
MQLFMLFMLLWGLNFIVALGHMTLAGAFASYYWAWEKPRDIPAFPLTSSVYRSIRYHLGSLAFGSFIIAVVQMIRIALEYLEYKLKDADNKVAKFIIKCLQCCFWCLEKFLKFLNKNAYIMIAIHGKNFCLSAKDAFFLIMRNIVRVVVLDKVTDFLLFLSKALVTGIVFTIAYVWFKGNITYFDNYVTRPELNYYLTPVIILTLCAYLMASVFFGVYSMAVDTLFLCFLEDLERNDGSAGKPYFMSKGLMKVLGKKNEKLSDPNEPKKGAKTSKVSPEEKKEKRPLPEPKDNDNGLSGSVSGDDDDDADSGDCGGGDVDDDEDDSDSNDDDDHKMLPLLLMMISGSRIQGLTPGLLESVPNHKHGNS